IASYIHSLTQQIIITYSTASSRVSMNIAITDIFLAITTAIPCGLIINELVSNSLKHAFPDKGEGEIKITMHHINENEVELMVSDNGIGFTKDIDFRNTESLGMQLVITLVEQFEGTIELDRAEGTAFKIRFSQTS
ncbi:histidine kinase, partial [bacterium]|nr:histidine kinase [bacterium]